MTSLAKHNRLADSLSPYLRQHADNPVHWQPWDDEALALAKEHDAPILLSVGYAACHWCHVMEHECFADATIAAQMNEAFVCIKVDREERPDLDKAYQLAHYLLSRAPGGWPLTAFLASDLVPFFSGTYFPPKPAGKMMSFPQVMERVSRVWTGHRDEIGEQNRSIAGALAQIDAVREPKELGQEVVDRCIEQLAANFDMDNGGLGLAPKFPQVPALRCALLLLARGERHLRQGLELTLDAMAAGGLRDHVGGGFFRYCVDPKWEIPHFEKMLSDNAQLLELYAIAAIVLDNPAYAQVAESIAGWMLDEMLLPEGGFASALDADSEDAEGKYYVWRRAELQEHLTGEQLRVLDRNTNAAGPVNFEGGMLHLRLRDSERLQPVAPKLATVFARLRKIRARRARPLRDDKALLGNCALAANALALAGLLAAKPGWLKQARATLAFIDGHMREQGEYKNVWRQGRLSPIPAFLDDHAALLQARLTMLQVACDRQATDELAGLAARIEERFADGKGGLLFAAKEAPQTIRQTRSCDDGPTPAGNGVIAHALLKLGYVFGEIKYLEQARAIIAGFSFQLSEAPAHAPSMVLALEEMHNPQSCVTLTGAAGKLAGWEEQLVRARAGGVVAVKVAAPEGLPPNLAKDPPATKGGVAAYVCKAMVCAAPVTSKKALRELLQGKAAPAAKQ